MQVRESNPELATFRSLTRCFNNRAIAVPLDNLLVGNLITGEIDMDLDIFRRQIEAKFKKFALKPTTDQQLACYGYCELIVGMHVIQNIFIIPTA